MTKILLFLAFSIMTLFFTYLFFWSAEKYLQFRARKDRLSHLNENLTKLIIKEVVVTLPEKIEQLKFDNVVLHGLIKSLNARFDKRK